MSSMNAKTRSKANRSLNKVETYHRTPGLALSAVLAALEPLGLTFGMVYQPKTGRTVNVLTVAGQEVENARLVVQTHAMESGRTELTVYVS